MEEEALHCQTFYRIGNGKEIQCDSKRAYLRDIGDKIIPLCPEHCLLFYNQIYPTPPLALTSVNITRLGRAIFGDPSLKFPKASAPRFRAVINTLARREKAVLIWRFSLGAQYPKSLLQTAKMMGVTRERIRQIEAKALRQLRHPARSHQIKDLARSGNA